MKLLTITRTNDVAIICTIQNAFLGKVKVKTYFNSFEKKCLTLHSDDSNISTLNYLEYDGTMEYQIVSVQVS